MHPSVRNGLKYTMSLSNFHYYLLNLDMLRHYLLRCYVICASQLRKQAFFDISSKEFIILLRYDQFALQILTIIIKTPYLLVCLYGNHLCESECSHTTIIRNIQLSLIWFGSWIPAMLIVPVVLTSFVIRQGNTHFMYNVINLLCTISVKQTG